MIRLLIVDDQTLVRQGLKSLLDARPDMEVVGEAQNGEEALEQVAQLKPDLVLMDVRMPVMDGVVATQEICQRFPGTRILVLTTFDDDDYVGPAIRYGAIGYLLKDTPSEELAQAIRAAHKGYTQLGPGLLQKALAYVPSPDPLLSDDSSSSDRTALAKLTQREREVLALIAKGSSNREIAKALCITEKTVKNHVTNILSRLNLRDRTQAAILANALSASQRDRDNPRKN